MRAAVRNTSLLSLMCLAAAGCSLFGFGQHPAPPPPPPPAPALPPPLPLPIATERFELAPGQDVVGEVQVVTATKEDTLTDLARRFNLGYEEIVRANPKVDPWLPGEGTRIVLPTQFVLPEAPRTGLVINIAAMRIYYFPPTKAGERPVVITHPIGIGKVGWRTPEGVTKITRRQKDPVWRVPVSVRKEHKENGEDLDPVIGPGPDNPLGRYAFYLQWPSYLIHGTNKPAGVGLRSSHGCIRLFPEDIEQFYKLVPVGTQVRVVNQPVVFGWLDGRLYLQPYDVLEDDKRDWTKAEHRLVDAALAARQKQPGAGARAPKVDWARVASLTRDPRGIPVPVTTVDADLAQVLAAAPLVQNVLPRGSTWDGTSDLPMDEASFKQIVSEIEPQQPSAAAAAPAEGAVHAGGAAPAAPHPAPRDGG